MVQPLISSAMATNPSSETTERINSRQRRNDNVIHPVDIEAPPPITTTTRISTRPPLLPTPVLYRDIKHFKKWRPWLLHSFVVVNTVLFIITMYVNNCPKNSFSCIDRFLGRFSFQPFQENPMLGPTGYTLQKMGALDVYKVIHEHQGWRLISCIWLHGGVFHLLANMSSLWIIGMGIERQFGFVRVGLLYFISGFGGNLLSALFNRLSSSVGASGALFGLLGGMLSDVITNWTIYENKVAVLLYLLIIIVINLATGILPFTDNFGHIGGFLSGFLLGFVFFIRPQIAWIRQKYTPPEDLASVKAPKFKTYQCILWIISLILLIIGFTLGTVMLFRGVDANDHCSWCHYMNCVPTKKWSCNTSAYCLTTDFGNHLNITCTSNGKSSLYILPDATSSQIQSLCTELCRV